MSCYICETKDLNHLVIVRNRFGNDEWNVWVLEAHNTLPIIHCSVYLFYLDSELYFWCALMSQDVCEGLLYTGVWKWSSSFVGHSDQLAQLSWFSIIWNEFNELLKLSESHPLKMVFSLPNSIPCILCVLLTCLNTTSILLSVNFLESPHLQHMGMVSSKWGAVWYQTRQPQRQCWNVFSTLVTVGSSYVVLRQVNMSFVKTKTR